MAYQIVGFTTSQVTGDKIIQILCDTPTDLPSGTISGDYGGPVVQGCSAKIISTGDSYVADSSGNWVLQPGSAWTNVYSKSEIDSMFSALNILTRADLYRGYQIAANTDLNTLTDYGTYYCSDSTTASTLTNCPITGSGFIMTIFSNGNRVRMLYAVSANYPRMYIQARTSGTWQTIREFAMIDQIPSASDINLLTSTTIERITLRESVGGTTEASTTRIGSQDYFEIPAGSHSFTFDSYYRNGRLQAFVCYYDSNKTYLGNTEWVGYANWKDPGYAFPIPTGASYFRVCFRYSDNATITVSSMIKCILSFA